MRYLEANRSKQQTNGLPVLRLWLRKAFTKGRMKREQKRNKNELSKLSHHLLKDLGFTSEAQPLLWSSYFRKKSAPSSVQIAGKRKNNCQQHCDCKTLLVR